MNRRGPAISRVPRPDQTEIGPVCGIYFCAAVEPSNRLGVAVYAPTLLLTTNFRPVSVVAWCMQAAGELEEVQVQRGQEALQVRRLVDGEVDLAGRDGRQRLRLQVEAAGLHLADQVVLGQRGAEQGGGSRR